MSVVLKRNFTTILIAAQISIESEDTVDCQGRKGFFELEFTGVYISQREYQMAPHNQL